MAQTPLPIASLPADGSARAVRLIYEVPEPAGQWRLDEDDMPEIPLHDQIIQLLELLLAAYVERTHRSALVTSNLGCRWDPDDARVGTDPDVVLIEPAPPEGEFVTTLRVWEPGHRPPRVAVEVVSENSAEKDYLEAPLRCGRLGAKELWVFDPQLQGPSSTGGPFRLQVWRLGQGGMSRSYAGAGPARTEELGAWLVVTDAGRRLRLAEDASGQALWQTSDEERAQRAEGARLLAEDGRQKAEGEREEQRKRAEAAEARVRELEAQIKELAGTRGR